MGAARRFLGDAKLRGALLQGAVDEGLVEVGLACAHEAVGHFAAAWAEEQHCGGELHPVCLRQGLTGRGLAVKAQQSVVRLHLHLLHHVAISHQPLVGALAQTFAIGAAWKAEHHHQRLVPARGLGRARLQIARRRQWRVGTRHASERERQPDGDHTRPKPDARLGLESKRKLRHERHQDLGGHRVALHGMRAVGLKIDTG